MNASGPHESEKGAAVILVIWAIGIMAVVAIIMAREAHLGAASAYDARNDLTATILAEGGLRIAVDLWETGHPEFRKGESITCRLGDDLLRLEVRPTSALIDLNTAPEGVLSGLFKALGESEQQANKAAAAIADYRDADDTPRPGGAERIVYEREGRTRPANRPFLRVAELAAVAGIPPRLAEMARPHLTLLNGTPTVSLLYASERVQAAVQGQSLTNAQSLPQTRSVALRDAVSRLSALRSNGDAGAPLTVRAAARLHSGRMRVVEATFGRTGRSGPSRTIIEIRVAPANDAELSIRPNASLPSCY